MATPVRFSKERAQELIGRIARGEAIAPAKGDAWTIGDLQQVAGVMLFAVLDAGPNPEKGKDWTKVHPERREAAFAEYRSDLFAVLEFIAQRAQEVRDRRFDERFGPEVRAMVARVGESVGVAPVEGFKENTLPKK